MSELWLFCVGIINLYDSDMILWNLCIPCVSYLILRDSLWFYTIPTWFWEIPTWFCEIPTWFCEILTWFSAILIDSHLILAHFRRIIILQQFRLEWIKRLKNHWILESHRISQNRGESKYSNSESCRIRCESRRIEIQQLRIAKNQVRIVQNQVRIVQNQVRIVQNEVRIVQNQVRIS
jgi:hypothetical protein